MLEELLGPKARLTLSVAICGHLCKQGFSRWFNYRGASWLSSCLGLIWLCSEVIWNYFPTVVLCAVMTSAPEVP